MPFFRAPVQERVSRCEDSGTDGKLATSYWVQGQGSSGSSRHCPISQEIFLRQRNIALPTWVEKDLRI